MDAHLSRMGDEPNMACVMLSKPLDHRKHLTHILSFGSVRNKVHMFMKVKILQFDVQAYGML